MDQAQRVLADGRAQPNERLSAALLIYSMTAPSSPPYAEAWTEMVRLGFNPTNPISLDALVFLARQSGPTSAPASLDSPTNFSIGPSTAPRGLELSSASGSATVSPAEAQIAAALDQHPKARPYHHLLALECRAKGDPSKTGEYLREAIDRFGQGDDETLTELGSWLYRSGRFEMLLAAVPLDRALRQQKLFLQRLDALSALVRFNQVVDLLQSQRFSLDPMVEHIYLAIARMRLGQSVAAQNEWQRALESAEGVPKLISLGTEAEGAGVLDVAGSAFAAANRLEPENRVALAGRLRSSERQGETAQALAVVEEIVERWPNDTLARNDERFLRLLLREPKADTQEIERSAEALVRQLPSNWSIRATLALARLSQGRFAEALRAFDGLKAAGTEPPGALAVRAAALAANGFKEGAQNDARNLGASYLLPEERALIAPLLGEIGEEASVEAKK